MKIQAIRNYATTGNYQANKTNQQSFGQLILDERGMEKLSSRAHEAFIKKTFENLKKYLGTLIDSKERDVLVYPFQTESGYCGITIARPLESGHVVSSFFSVRQLADFNDEFIGGSGITGYIKRSLNPDTAISGTTTFEKCAKATSTLPEYFWNTKLPLSPEFLEGRFATLA